MRDPEALKQVLINLLSNAEKYSPRKKEIEVEVSRSGIRGGGASCGIAASAWRRRTGKGYSRSLSAWTTP